SLNKELSAAKSRRTTDVDNGFSAITKWKQAITEQQRLVASRAQEKVTAIQHNLEQLDKLYDDFVQKEQELQFPVPSQTTGGTDPASRGASSQADFYRVQRELIKDKKRGEIEELKRIQFQHGMAMAEIQQHIDDGLNKIASAEQTLGIPFS